MSKNDGWKDPGKDEKDSAYDSFKEKQESSKKAKGVLRGAGYARGGGVSPMKAKKIADKEVHKHEKHDHKGKKPTKLKQGGKIEGKKPRMRADKYARGGSVPKGHHTRININVGSSQADRQQAAAKGAQMGDKLMAAKMGAAGAGGPPRPGAGAPMQARPMAPPPPGGGAPGGMPPGGGPPGVPPTMGAKRGGRMYAKGGKVGPVKVPGTVHLKGGAGGGLGRQQKQAAYGTKPKA